MGDGQRRDQLHRGPGARGPRSAAERRQLEALVQRLRASQAQAPVDWEDRATDGQRGTQPAVSAPVAPQARQRPVAPPSEPGRARRERARAAEPAGGAGRTRMAPEPEVPRRDLSEAPRAAILERAGASPYYGGVDWAGSEPAPGLAERIRGQEERLEEARSELLRSTTPEDRGTVRVDGERLRRQLLGEQGPLERVLDAQTLELGGVRQLARASIDGEGRESFRPRPSRRPVTDAGTPWYLLRPERAAARAEDAWEQLLRDHRDAGPLGVAEGLRRVIVDLLRTVGSLIELLGGLPEVMRGTTQWVDSLDEEERRDLQHLIALDRQGLQLLGEMLRQELDDPAVLPALGEVLMAPFDNVAEHLVAGVREAEEGDQVEAAARIVQGTFAFVDLLGALEGFFTSARRSPRLVARLGQLREALSDGVQRARRGLGEALPFAPSGDGRTRGRRRRRQEGSVRVPGTGGGRGGGTGRRDSGRSGDGTRAAATAPSRRLARRTQAQLRAFRSALRLRRTGPDARRLRALLTEYEWIPRRGITEDTFREWALDVISRDPDHPLWPFVDTRAGRFSRPSGSGARGGVTLEDHLAELTFEMGHEVSRSSGAPERLALQYGLYNQLEGRYSEALGHFVDRGPSVIIGGIPVERQTALLLEAEGYLAPGTVARSPSARAWSLYDWTVRPGDAPGDLVWERVAGGRR